MLNEFHHISISGRYIYCYLCLRNVILNKSLDDIPEVLDRILKDFTINSRLDNWQDAADDVMPSRLLDQQNNMDQYKTISPEQALSLIAYYKKNELAAQVIEILIWLGVSDLYVAFDSVKTFDCVSDVIEILNNNNIQLPDFSVIKSCSVSERGGWGNLVDIDTFLNLS